MKPGTAEILPGPRDADPRLQRAASRGRRSAPRAGARSRSARSTRAAASSTCTCTAASPSRSSTGTRTTRSRTATERLYKYPNVAALGDALVPRPRARRDGEDAVRRPGRVLPPRRPGRQAPRPAAGRLRRAADDHGPLVQRGRLVPLPDGSRPRLPRRHDPGQRRGRAADEGRAAAVPLPLPQRRPTRGPTSSSWATGARWSRSAPTAACCRRRSCGASIPMEPAERVDVIVDFRQFGVGSKVILHNTVGEPSTSAVMRFDVVRGGAEEARIPKMLREDEELPGGQRGALVAADLPGPGGRRLGVADRRRRVLRDADRLPARARARPSCGRGSTCPTRTHPMHMHGYHFRVVTSNGKPPHPGDRGLEGHGRGLSATRPSSCGRTSTTSRASTSSTAMPPSTATCR